MQARSNSSGHGKHHAFRPAGQPGQNGAQYFQPSKHRERVDRPLQQHIAVAPAVEQQLRQEERQKMRPMPPGPMQQFPRVILPILRGQYLDIAQVLVIMHGQGDVTVLDAASPRGMELSSDGRGAAVGIETHLRGDLRGGDHYEVITIYRLPNGAFAFQRFGLPRAGDGRWRRPTADTDLADFSEKLSSPRHWFPDIRRGNAHTLQVLSEFTGFRFEVNTQIRFHEYQRINDQVGMDAFNARDYELLRQSMEQFADVAWGTPLEIARRQVAAAVVNDPLRLAEEAMIARTMEVALTKVTIEEPAVFTAEAPIAEVSEETIDEVKIDRYLQESEVSRA